jgi:hypothetical protein
LYYLSDAFKWLPPGLSYSEALAQPRTDPISGHLIPNNYALYLTLLHLHPHVYCIKSHGTGKEETLAVAAVQVLDIG